jgi:hypothetical protein
MDLPECVAAWEAKMRQNYDPLHRINQQLLYLAGNRTLRPSIPAINLFRYPLNSGISALGTKMGR